MTTRSVPAGSAVSACHTMRGLGARHKPERARHVALAIDAGENDDGGFHASLTVRIIAPSTSTR